MMIREVKLLLKNKEIGRFSLDGYKLNNEFFDTGNTISMNINVDEEYQGKGYSKIMMRCMIDKIYKEYPNIRQDQLLFIDADASNGFWSHVGMKPNRYYSSTLREYEGRGYELYITFRELENYIFKYN